MKRLDNQHDASFDKIMMRNFTALYADIEPPIFDKNDMVYMERCFNYCIEMYFRTDTSKIHKISKFKLLNDIILKVGNRKDPNLEEGVGGYCQYDRNKTKIVISEDHVCIEVMAHELAHAIEFMIYKNSNHDSRFNEINLACDGKFYKDPSLENEEGEEWKKGDY